MPDFKGKIRLEDGDGLETTLTVDSGRFVAKAGEHEIGNWAVNELSVVRRNSEFLIKVEGEELVVVMADPLGFSEILGVKEEKSKERRRKTARSPKLRRKERSTPEAKPPDAAPPAYDAALPAYAVPAPAVVAEPAPVAATGVVQAADEVPLWQRIPMRTKLIGLGVIGFVVFFIVAPSLLALLLLLAGVGTLFLAIAAKNESGSGFLPPPFFATNTAVAGGIGSVVLSLVIMVIT
jgi:hypothetical protein